MLVYPFPKPERIVHTCVLRHLVFLYYTERFVQLLWRACQEILRTAFRTNLIVRTAVAPIWGFRLAAALATTVTSIF